MKPLALELLQPEYEPKLECEFCHSKVEDLEDLTPVGLDLACEQCWQEDHDDYMNWAAK